MSGRRRPTKVDAGELSDILTLANGGHSLESIARILDRDMRTVARAVAEHRAQQREPYVAQMQGLYMQAATVAAEKGDHRPALEWLDRMGVMPETSRDRTLLAMARERADAQKAVASSYVGAGAGKGAGATVNIGIGFPAQLTGSVSQTTEPGSMQVSLALENQQLTDTLCDTKLVGPRKP